jgi:hypothetical protein
VTSTGLDAYAVVTPLAPEPPEPEPDAAEIAWATQQAMFAQEHAGAWTAPLSPARDGRQRTPEPPEASGPPDGARGTERSAMCILGPDGGHLSRGRHCPHNLPADGDDDEIVARISF